MRKQYVMAVLAMGLWACGPGEMVEGREEAQATQSVSQQLVRIVGPLQEARWQHSSTKLLDGRVLFVSGGVDRFGSTTTTAEVYNPVTQTTSFVAPMHTARRLHTEVRLQDGSVLVLGGLNWNGSMASVERYNPGTNTWTEMSPMPFPSYKHTATLLANGRVLVAGGSNSSGYSANAYLFDPTTNTWTATGSLTLGRNEHVAVKLPDNRVLVMGGIGSTSAVQTSIEIYDPGTGTWSTHAPSPLPNPRPSAVLLSDGRVLFGSEGRDIQRYDVSTNTWTTLPQLNRDHWQGKLVLLNGQLLMVAGYWDQSIEWFDSVQQQWVIVGQVSIPQYSFGFSVDTLADGSALIAGGQNSNNNVTYATMDLFTLDSTCTPRTCASQGAQCGTIPDGCGGTLSCGTCGSGYTCSSSNACVPSTPAPPAGSLTYSATNTNSAQQNTSNRTLTLNVGDTLEVGTCGLTGATASGDTYLRLFGVSATEVAYNDDSCGGLASFIRYTVPASGTYEVRAGCYGGNSCSGTVVFNVIPAAKIEPLTYSATNTNSAQQNTVNRTFTLKAGDKVEVGTCNLTGATATGDTYLRLFGASATQVAYNDDSCGGLSSFIQYTATTSGSYELRAGCYSGNTCSGTVVFRLTPG